MANSSMGIGSGGGKSDTCSLFSEIPVSRMSFSGGLISSSKVKDGAESAGGLSEYSAKKKGI